MRRGLCLLATVTLSSALYAQPTLGRQETADLFGYYNPQLMARAGQEDSLRQLVEQVISSYASRNLPDTPENRYTLIAVARNFDNSLSLQKATQQYQRALLYGYMGNESVQEAARSLAQRSFADSYARIWGVSVQVKEELLKHYQQLRNQVPKRSGLTTAEKKSLRSEYEQKLVSLREELKNLRTQPGQHLAELTQQALTSAEAQVRAAVSLLEAGSADNLQIKTKHKKPVAQ